MINRSMVSILLLVVGCVSTADARHFHYEVRWQFFRVGSVVLEFIDDVEKNQVRASIETLGPFKLLRRYDANIVATGYSTGDRTYELRGLDRGANEERFITYGPKRVPVVEVFREVDTPAPLSISVEKDADSVDPVFVLTTISHHIETGRKCADRFKIYDGKRRYTVETTSLAVLPQSLPDDMHERGDIALCEIRLVGASVEYASDLNRRKKSLRTGIRGLLGIWPFTREDQVLKVWLSKETSGVYPVRFQLMTPLGRVVGRLQTMPIY